MKQSIDTTPCSDLSKHSSTHILDPQDNQVAINIENVTKTYRLYNTPLDRLKEALSPVRQKYHHDFFALTDINFQIKKGETVGIIGTNGSGKSTLLKIISGVLTPTRGSVHIKGRISALLELGAGFNYELTGVENVFFNGALMGYSRDEMQMLLDEILSFADIGEFAYQPVKNYSSGMFLRLAFAVAICVDPDILIVDEALSVGDVKFQRKCFSKIEDFSAKNKTILFVSHAPSVVNNLCNNAILLEKGRLICMDLPKVVTKIYHELIFGRESEFDNSNEQINDSINNIKTTTKLENITADFQLKVDAMRRFNVLEKDCSKQELRNGNGSAEIIDYGILDSTGNSTRVLSSGQKYTLVQRILFYENIDKYFSAFAIRDVLGTELFYTNTEILQTPLTPQCRGGVLEVTADITMWLAAGEYFLSCIVFNKDKSDYADRRLDVYHLSVRVDSANGGGYVNLNPIMNANTLIPNLSSDKFSKIDELEDVTFYSQHGEDVILDRIFRNVTNGFFVEVGCIDGKRFSNTLTFEERGWKGICIEAHTDYIELLKNNRPNSIVVHCAVGESDEGQVNFYANSRGSLSTLDSGQEINFRNKFGHWFSGFTTQRVPKKKLDTIFEELEVSKINILSIDIEGTEIEALRGLTVSKWLPELIIIETDQDEEKFVDDILLPCGYKKIYRIPNNTFYTILENTELLEGNVIHAEVLHTQHPLDTDGDKKIHVELHV